MPVGPVASFRGVRVFVVFTAGFLYLLSDSTALFGQVTLAGKDETQPDYEVFLVYVLQDFYGDTSLANGSLPEGPRALKQFLRSRRTQIDKVLAALEKIDSDDPALHRMFLRYRVVLGELKLDEMLSELAARQDKYDTGIRAIYAEVDREMVERRDDAAEDVLETIIEAGLSPPYNSERKNIRHMMLMGMLSGLLNEKRLAADHARLMADASRNEATYAEIQFPALQADLAMIRQKYASSFETVRAKAIADARTEVAEFARRKGLVGSDAAFDPDNPPANPYNPFLIAARHRSLTRPVDKDQDEIDRYRDAALACLKAEKLIPEGKLFVSFKSRLVLRAGVLANLAAEAQTGSAGFRNSPGRHKVGSPAAVAVQAWRKYAELEQPDYSSRGFVVHQTVTAYAHAGLLHDANRILASYIRRSSGKGWSAVPNPKVWYDFARIAALKPYSANSGALRPDYNLAVACLRVARRMGYNDIEEAETNPDFQHLYKGTPAVQAAFTDALALDRLVID